MSGDLSIWRGPGMGWVARPTPAARFKVGDIVTRGDGDRHIVEAVNDFGDLIDVRCITGASWCQPGDAESNLASRYMHAGAIIEGDRV